MANTSDMDEVERRKTSKLLQELAPTSQLYSKILLKQKEILDLSTLAIEEDDFAKMAEEEALTCKKELNKTQEELVKSLAPKDNDDKNNAILEVRAGTGGKEASLFARNIFEMYKKLSTHSRWRFEILNESSNETDGLKEASASITGLNVFGSLKYEIGVHRVQRIPVTESQGRVHTSTITVAVLPQPNEIDINVNPADIRFETFKSSGPGGQHVNKTDSAVRAVHVPTGMVVVCQDDRSQLKNKSKALRILHTRLYDQERQKADRERRETRRVQIGSGDRSERIRTYNFLQDRITDHRVNITLHGVEEFLQGGQKLENLIEELRDFDQVLAFDKLVNLSTNI
eukprot:gene5412-6088_t